VALATLASLLLLGLGAGLERHRAEEAKATALAAAHDCTVSLWGPTESDAVDVADCVSSAIRRALP